MAFYYSKRKLKVRESEDTGELNIVPYLDILMNLIIFMLLSMTGLAAFGILNVNAPNYGPVAGGPGAENPDQPKLLLTVAIADKGFFVAGTGGVLGGAADNGAPNTSGQPTIPRKADGTYDYGSLQAQILNVKKAFPQETKVIIAADKDIAYDVLIQTMDTLRESSDHKLLFPDVTLAAM